MTLDPEDVTVKVDCGASESEVGIKSRYPVIYTTTFNYIVQVEIIIFSRVLKFH